MGNTALLNCTEIIYISVDNVHPNPNQPRRFFDVDQLAELSSSIKEYGVIQPISVRQVGSKYELVAGERRLRASKLAGLTEIPAIVVEIDTKDSAMVALIENVLRQNLNFIEEAEGMLNLMYDYHFTQEELARKLGKNQSTIANKLRILKLPKEVKDMLLANDLTERHARVLLKLPNTEQQLEVLHKVISGGLTVKKTEDLVEDMLKRSQEEAKPVKTVHERRFIKDVRLFTNTIKQAVDIMNASGVETIYNVNQTEDYYEIAILISANNNVSDLIRK